MLTIKRKMLINFLLQIIYKIWKISHGYKKSVKIVWKFYHVWKIVDFKLIDENSLIYQ